MPLNEAMVINYLVNTCSLETINNHDVKDSFGNKTGQLPLTIQIGRQCIDDLLEQDEDHEDEFLTDHERNALIQLKEALDALPTSLGIQTLRSLVDGLDYVQQNLFDSIRNFLKSICHFEEYKMMLKAVVLVLKITEYDLSKKPGPILVGYGFIKFQVLSNEQRIDNLQQVQKLLKEMIRNYGDHFETEEDLQVSQAVV